ncbi:flagellar hook-length control protein FliK [Ideonella sp. B7]|uniref:flagellar hook-length control protein FliK n=1 Tax=Ideonella benzenivorans TaxID=2831643 RepID=UPI002872F7EA|nr:flagellar hook-length control protein FliK [Ideonella benzenivorans]MCA6217977.1 flagellar hook-length control protein FliK [Ideonella benzenivorans]
MALTSETSTSALERLATTKSATQRQQSRTGHSTPASHVAQAGNGQTDGLSAHAKSFAQMLRNRHAGQNAGGQETDTRLQARHTATRKAEKASQEAEASAAPGTSQDATARKTATEDTEAAAAQAQTPAQAASPSTVALVRGGADAARGRRAGPEGLQGQTARAGGGEGRHTAAAGHRSAEAAAPETGAAAGARAAGPGAFAAALQQAGDATTGADGSLRAVLAATHDSTPAPGAATADPGLASLGALAAPNAAPAAGSPDAPAPASATAQLPMAPDHPEFPAALGVQLSTWVQDGIEHATLELHPQDLGPIEVHIAVRDGQTQVDLNSAVPGTREALNLALPQLSSQLDGVGLSLAGGSVSDQGRRGFDSPSGQAAGSGRGRSTTALGGVAGADDSAAGAARPVVRQRGLVDFYA